MIKGKKLLSSIFVSISVLIVLFSFKPVGFIPDLLSVPDDLRVFSFKANESKILPGLSTEKKSSYNCSGKILDQDHIGKLTLIAILYQNGCYTDGRYNHNKFKVEHGKVSDSNNEFSFDAYRIYEPTQKASEFLGTQHCLAYKFPKKENYSVYELVGDKVNKLADIKASKIKPNELVLIKKVTVSKTTGYRTFFFAPSSKQISVYTQYSEKVEGARIKKTKFGSIYKYRYQVDRTPFDRTVDWFNNRQFFLFAGNKKSISVIWQDKDNQDIVLSNFTKDLKSETNIKLTNLPDAQLVATTKDESGNYYYLTVQSKTSRAHSDIVTLYKTDSRGNVIDESQPETSKSGLNIFRFNDYMADLEYLNGQLGLFIARTMHKSGDGLNHQGGIAVVFDANSLKVLKNFGQTSGHSFDNYLTHNSKGEFMGIDLGDNYPRGIHLHKFTDTKRNSRVIYTFKTQHGSSARSPAGKSYPAYSEISGSGKKYYKWSNDNGTYSTLGALIETDDGYVVIFTGEPDPNGKSINNARADGKRKDSRNIGFIKIAKGFENSAGRGNVVSDDIVPFYSISKTISSNFFSILFPETR